ncbi:hypothetical protein OQA88_12428 [Cercophora sp. LCS_1]
MATSKKDVQHQLAEGLSAALWRSLQSVTTPSEAHIDTLIQHVEQLDALHRRQTTELNEAIDDRNMFERSLKTVETERDRLEQQFDMLTAKLPSIQRRPNTIGARLLETNNNQAAEP